MEKRHRRSDDELRAQLRQVAAVLGRSPKAVEVSNSSVIVRRFGTWNAALVSAGLASANRGRRVLTDEELLRALRHKAQQLGRTPKIVEVNADPGMPGHTLYHRRFGGHRAACIAAGLDVCGPHAPRGTFSSQLDRYLQRTYGIKEAEYLARLAEQGGVCAICGGEEEGPHGRLYVDHCHGTGVVRGLLCNRCNTCTGAARDNPSVLAAAASYLLTDPRRCDAVSIRGALSPVDGTNPTCPQ